MKQDILNKAIDEFFEGKIYFSEYRSKLGYIWVCKHGKKILIREHRKTNSANTVKLLPDVISSDKEFVYIHDFQTLTIEPLKGGQYEIAVRIWSEGEWKGYRINHEDVKYIHNHFLSGVNTRGH